MLHPQHGLLLPPKLSFRDLIPLQVLQVLSLSYPLGVDPIKAPNLPPLVTTNDVLEVVRTEPIDQRVRSCVASRDWYRDGDYGRPWRGWNMRVCAKMKLAT